MEILKRQRDAVGLSVYSDTYEYYAPEKGSDRHRKMILHQLESLLNSNHQLQQKPISIYMKLQKTFIEGL